MKHSDWFLHYRPMNYLYLHFTRLGPTLPNDSYCAT
jgi:hypothetical protein